jgi:hypothetical protein
MRTLMRMRMSMQRQLIDMANLASIVGRKPCKFDTLMLRN